MKDKVFSNWSADYNYLLCLRNNFGNNPLHCAIFSNKVEVLKLLIDTYRQLFDPNGGQLHEFPWLHQNYRKETPLHLAIERGGEDIVLYLLCLDSRLAGIPNFQGKSPLFLAVECGRANIVQEILHHGTGPFLLGGPKGKNPLHIASKCPGTQVLFISFTLLNQHELFYLIFSLLIKIKIISLDRKWAP